MITPTTSPQLNCDLSSIALINDSVMRSLLDLRGYQLTNAAITLETPVELIIVEAGDTLGDVAAVSGCSLDHIPEAF